MSLVEVIMSIDVQIVSPVQIGLLQHPPGILGSGNKNALLVKRHLFYHLTLDHNKIQSAKSSCQGSFFTVRKQSTSQNSNKMQALVQWGLYLEERTMHSEVEQKASQLWGAQC